MCARYSISKPSDLQVELALRDVVGFEPRFNVAPTQVAPILTAVSPQVLTLARWGLIPSWAKDATIATRTINARSETIEEKGVFKESFERRRCLVPMSSFFEWDQVGQQKQPMAFAVKTKRPFTLGGLWDTWSAPNGETVTTFTIVTTHANKFMGQWHDRMPVIVPPELRSHWLNDTKDQVKDLFVPAADDLLVSWDVDPRVNSVKVDDPKCIEPAPRKQLSLF